MIAMLKGIVVAVSERSVIVDVNGVGYEVFVTRDLAVGEHPGNNITLFTYFNVREDVQELFGFRQESELSFFKLLLTVSGIGPRSAINIMDTAKPDDIRQAVAGSDAAILHRVYGIGKKTAERLVTELKDKLETGSLAYFASGDETSVIEAITGLGYSLTEARQALKEIGSQGKNLSDKIKLALKYLGRK